MKQHILCILVILSGLSTQAQTLDTLDQFLNTANSYHLHKLDTFGKGNMFGTYYYYNQITYLPVTDETAMIYPLANGMAITEVLVPFGDVEIVNSTDSIALNIYAFENGEPDNVLHKQYVSLDDLNVSTTNTLTFSSIPLSIPVFNGGNDSVLVSLDYSSISDDTLGIISSDFSTMSEPKSLRHKASSYFGGDWFMAHELWGIGYDVNVFIIPIVTDQFVSTQQPFSQNTSWKVFPNPTTDFITVRFQESKAATNRFMLIDAQGKMIKQFQQANQVGENTVQIDLSNYPNGIYFLVKEGNIANGIKIVKQ